MTTQIQRRRGTTTEHGSFTGAVGEITIDTTKDTVVVHDGSTAGGHPLAKENNPTFTGNCGIGTAAPGQLLHLNSSASTAIQISDGTNNQFISSIKTAGNFANGSTVGDILIRGQSGFAVSSNNGSSVALRIDSSGNVNIVGTGTSATPKTVLNANGSAAFGGDVVVGNNPTSGSTSNGLMFRATGGVISRRASGTDNAFAGFVSGNASETSKITAAGSATFAGNAQLTKPRSSTAGSNTGSLSINPSDTTHYWNFRVDTVDNDLRIDTVQGADKIKFGASGSATFTGFVDFTRSASDGFGYLAIGPGGTNEKASFVNRSGEIDLELYSNYSSSPTVSINSDGTATFAADATINSLTVGRGAGNVSTNAAVGNDALNSNTSGGHNAAYGAQALQNNTTASSCTAVGSGALLYNITGSHNTAAGYRAGFTNTSGTYNVANGSHALYSNTTGVRNIALGSFALYTNTTGGNNVSAGQNSLYSNTSGNYNVALGSGALQNNTTASNNTATGYLALHSNTTGHSNVAVGANALQSNTTGFRNTAIGYLALRNSTTGIYNTATGFYTLVQNTTGSYNVAYGYQALNANTTGSLNVATGYQALKSNTTGIRNTATGYEALFTNTTGNYNAAYGYYSLYSNTTGISNTAYGYRSAQNNTTGNNNVANGQAALFSNTTGTENVAVGANALYFSTTADYNTANGYKALYTNTTGHSNTANGQESLQLNTTGAMNTGYGRRTLKFNTTGSNNVSIGQSTLYNNTTGSGNIGIGFVNNAASYLPVFDPTTENNRLVLGHTSITNAYVKVAWTVTSDERDKMNFAPVPYGLDFVNQLKPTAYQFKVDRDTEIPNGDVRYGFKAQDILALEGDNPVIIDTEDSDHLKYKGEHLVPVLVNAVQELTTMVKELQAEIKTLKG